MHLGDVSLRTRCDPTSGFQAPPFAFLMAADEGLLAFVFPYVSIVHLNVVFPCIHPSLLGASPPAPLLRDRKRPVHGSVLHLILSQGGSLTSKLCKKQKMGTLYSEVFLPQRCKITTTTPRRRRRRRRRGAGGGGGGGGRGGLNHKLQDVNSVAVSFMMGLLIALQILVVKTGGIQIAAAEGGTVVKLKHRMAELGDDSLSFKSARQGGGGGGGGRGMSVEHYNRLKAHDKARRFNSLKTSSMIRRSRESLEVVDFDLYGHYLIDGLYYMEIMLGTPAQMYYVQMDTGSDLLWVDCSPCTSCPQSSSIQVPLTPYSESASSSNQAVGCNDAFCTSVSSDGLTASCGVGSSCQFESEYGDGSSVSGYIVSDLFTFDAISNSTNSTETVSTRVSFGCGNVRTGNLADTQGATTGLIGFGQHSISVLSQLAAGGTIPNTFAHCLQGETGTSSLVIGEITEPGITYTSMVPNQIHYTANLLNIAVQGSNISSSSGSNVQVTFDSGTTLATLRDPFFTDLVNAIDASITVPVRNIQDTPCYAISDRSNSMFPNVTLYFEGGTMELSPDSYLILVQEGDNSYYCIAWSASSGEVAEYSLLGDIVLQNQIIVYDNELNQIGWKTFNCSQPISATFTPSGPAFEQPPSAGSGASSQLSKTFMQTYNISFVAILYILGYTIFTVS